MPVAHQISLYILPTLDTSLYVLVHLRFDVLNLVGKILGQLKSLAKHISVFCFVLLFHTSNELGSASHKKPKLKDFARNLKKTYYQVKVFPSQWIVDKSL